MAQMQAVKISDCVDCAYEPVRRQHRVRGEHEAVRHCVLPILGLRRPVPAFRSPRNCLGGQAWSSGGGLKLGRRRNAENALAIEDDLIADPTLAMQSDAAVLLGQLDHLHAHVDDIADLDRTKKAQGLRDIDSTRPWQPHANHPGNEARGVEPVNNSTAKARLAREVLRQVDWIVVAGKFGEPDDVFILDRLANRRPHADREVFEIERLKQRILHALTNDYGRSRGMAATGHTSLSSYKCCSSIGSAGDAGVSPCKDR